ncbi:MAG: EAL domain-containing protein [Steroidobacteraceae bacterium]
MAALERLIHQRTGELQAASATLDVAQRQLQSVAHHEQQSMTTQARHRHMLKSELQQGLDGGQFSVYYQPLIDICTRRIHSFEALVRWHHPQQGMISPAAFIPVAEDSGLILPLGEFVLTSVCQQVVCWRRQGLPVVPVAVNISAVQLERENMWKLVRKILRATDMHPEHLGLEITESSLIKDGMNQLRHLHGLRRDGLRISIDDFGTGYSSLAYLKQLPIDTLKIDRSFINQIDVSSQDETIVSAIMTMAHSLGLKVVAEGVENETQLQVLRKHGCESAQGYFFSPPVPAEQCRALLQAEMARPVVSPARQLMVVDAPYLQQRNFAAQG